MDPISEAELAQLEELHRLSSRGRWTVDYGRVRTTIERLDGIHHYGVFDCNDTFREQSNQQQDCEFVVMAHELIPRMIAEIRELRHHLNPPTENKSEETNGLDAQEEQA